MSPKRWILLGIPVLGIAGCLMHFVYEWSGNSVIVGVFAPVNESIWEHLKMTFWPILIWWAVGYRIISRSGKVSAVTWSASSATAELVCPLVIMSFYYTYTGALGIESLVLDVFSLFLAVAVSQLLSLHLYRHARCGRGCVYYAMVVVVLLATAFTVFTFRPPDLPLFRL